MGCSSNAEGTSESILSCFGSRFTRCINGGGVVRSTAYAVLPAVGVGISVDCMRFAGVGRRPYSKRQHCPLSQRQSIRHTALTPSWRAIKCCSSFSSSIRCCKVALWRRMPARRASTCAGGTLSIVESVNCPIAAMRCQSWWSRDRDGKAQCVCVDVEVVQSYCWSVDLPMPSSQKAASRRPGALVQGSATSAVS